MADNKNSTSNDDFVEFGGEAQEAFLDVLAKSPIADLAGIEVPQREKDLEEDPEEDFEDDLEEESASVDIEDDEETEDDIKEDDEVEEEVEDDEESTQETETYTLDDLDGDALVTHKINGEDVTLPLSEWFANSGVKQSLSRQGRELGEARKKFEEERNNALQELQTVGAIAAQRVYQDELTAQKKYHEVKAKLEKAKEDGDTYEVGELTVELSKHYDAYFKYKNERESAVNKVQQQQSQAAQQMFQQTVQTFYQEIPTVIPDWSDEVQEDIRKFALEHNVPEELLNVVTDVNVVKFVDDMRRLVRKSEAGSTKRKAAPKKKVPLKRTSGSEEKAQKKKTMTKARAFREDASASDQDNFLLDHVSSTLQNLR